MKLEGDSERSEESHTFNHSVVMKYFILFELLPLVSQNLKSDQNHSS